MATYYAQTVSGGGNKPPAKGFPVGRTTTHFSFTPVLLTAGDIIVLAVIPIDTQGAYETRGTWVDFIFIDIPVIDTASALVWTLGDATTANSWLSGMTLGTTTKPGRIVSDSSAIAATNVGGSLGAGAIPRKYGPANVDTDLRMTVTTGQTALVATNPIKGYVTYTLEESI